MHLMKAKLINLLSFWYRIDKIILVIPNKRIFFNETKVKEKLSYA